MFLKSNTSIQIEDELNTIPDMGTLHHHLPPWNVGQLNLNVVIPAWETKKRSRHPKTAITDGNIVQVHKMMLDNYRNKMRGIVSQSRFGHEKVIRELIIIAAFVHPEPNACSNEHFVTIYWRSLGAINLFFCVINHCRWNMDTLLHPGNKNAIKKVDR